MPGTDTPDSQALGPQLRLDLERKSTFSREAFVVSPSNAAALSAIDSWPDWLGGALALSGPEGSGKSHLAAVWAERSGALPLTPASLSALDWSALGDRPVLLESADQAEDESLFHLINRAVAGGGGLLLVARDRPGAWRSELPDLRSRLNALQVAEIGEPDDALLAAVLHKFLRERSITPVADVLDYLVKRIERSVSEARTVANKLDQEMDLRQRPLTKHLARTILDGTDRTGDLFDLVD